nr:MAG TPA: hypothetical protein [Caudoviricetes sp.]DAX26107.1 MAG TPA: hypothetical protein [Caudoviricetes sp.]
MSEKKPSMLTSLMVSSQGLERLALEMEIWRNLLS